MASEAKLFEYTAAIKDQQRKSFRAALEDGDCADLTFLVGAERAEIKVNRAFVALMSPVFRAMLFGRMKEAEHDAEVPIPDIEPDVFECIIHFAYNNDPGISSKKLFPLITACDQYCITALRESCYNLLRSHLDHTSFCGYFHGAAQQKPFDQTVLRILRDFFVLNCDRCLNGDSFCSFFNELVVRNSFHLDLTAFINRCGLYIDGANRVLVERILRSQGFLTMTLKSMRLFLERAIQCKEETVWEAVVQWAEHQDSVYCDTQNVHCTFRNTQPTWTCTFCPSKGIKKRQRGCRERKAMPKRTRISMQNMKRNRVKRWVFAKR